MKRNTATAKQIIKPILYILLYVVILILFMNILTLTIRTDKGDYYPVKKEINANKNDRK